VREKERSKEREREQVVSAMKFDMTMKKNTPIMGRDIIPSCETLAKFHWEYPPPA
jgi:hypothetical protein